MSTLSLPTVGDLAVAVVPPGDTSVARPTMSRQPTAAPGHEHSLPGGRKPDLTLSQKEQSASVLARHLQAHLQHRGTSTVSGLTTPTVRPAVYMGGPHLGGPHLGAPHLGALIPGAHTPQGVQVPLTGMVGQPLDSVIVDVGDGRPLPRGQQGGSFGEQQGAGSDRRPPLRLPRGTAAGPRQANPPSMGQMASGMLPKKVAQMLESSLPFFALLMVKVMYSHRQGLLIVLALGGTFYYANDKFKKHITTRHTEGWRQTAPSIVWVIAFLAGNIVFLYYVFLDEYLYRSLYFQLPLVGNAMTVWSLFWIVIVTDFVAKFVTIAIKSFVGLLPRHIISFSRKGSTYVFLESVSQFYRSLLPVPPWVAFLMDSQYGGQWIAIGIVCVYAVFKGLHLHQKGKELKTAFLSCFQVKIYGSVPSGEEVQAMDNTCPICQDQLSSAVKLSCRHIFCEECVCLWFDREKTCPMCRSKIVDNPLWRDGATSAMLQLF